MGEQLRPGLELMNWIHHWILIYSQDIGITHGSSKEPGASSSVERAAVRESDICLYHWFLFLSSGVRKGREKARLSAL